MALGLNENIDDPKWFKRFNNAGEGAWLYSGVTAMYASAAENVSLMWASVGGTWVRGYPNSGRL